MPDTSVSLSVVLLGEARELLSALRRNRRFGYLLSFASTPQPAEHPLVKEVKSLREVVRVPVSAVLPNQSSPAWSDKALIPPDALLNALDPFFEVVRSRDASGIITGVALKSLRAIAAHIILLAKEKQLLREYAPALSSIIDAAAACRFDATDPASDEVVLSRITRVLTTVICSAALPMLADASVLRSIEACMGIASGRRRASILLKSTADAALVNICSAIGEQTHTIVTNNNVLQQSDTPSIFAHGVSGPAFGYAFDSDSFNQHGPSSVAMIAAIIELVSRMADPLYAQSSAERILGLELISSLLASAGTTLKSHPVLKQYLLRDCSRGILRTLGNYQSEPGIIAAAFTIATQLVHVLEENGAPLLFALLDRVYPYYISGYENVLPPAMGGNKHRTDDQPKGNPVASQSTPGGSGSLTPVPIELDPVIREIGLESLAALFSTPGLLCIMYRLADCEMKRTDMVHPLLEALGQAAKTNRFRRRSKRLRASSSGTHRLADATGDHESDDEDSILPISGGNPEASRFGRACALLCAEAVLAIIDTISDRLKLETTGLSSPPTMDFEAQKLGRQVRKEKKRLQRAGEEFNTSDKVNKAAKLIPILRKHGFIFKNSDSDGTVSEDLEGDVKAIVRFLRDTPGLSKEKIGVILGEPDNLSRLVLADYTATFKFAGRPFTESLRVFLESFRLPGEAQKISRIVQSFADRYFAQYQESPRVACSSPESSADESGVASVSNGSQHESGHAGGGVLKSADAAYVLSYSVVMLNTDLHNDSIRNKMTLEDFVRNCRGLNDKSDFPRWFLSEIYNSIAEVEIRMSDEAGIGALTDLLWDEQIKRMESEVSNFPTAQSSLVFEEDLFFLSWEAAVVATNSILNEAGDANSVQKALEGFLSVARCATSFRIGRPTDAVISSLCTATTVREGPLHGAAVRFGTDIKAQMASVALSGVSRQCGDWLQADGWQALVSYLLRLHALCLLPPELEQLLGGYGPELVMSSSEEQYQSSLIPAWWPSQVPKAGQSVEEEKPKRTTRANGFFAAILAASIGSELDSDDEDYDDHEDDGVGHGHSRKKVSHIAPSYLRMKTREETEALDLARRCIASCRIEDVVIKEAKVLQSSALEFLSQAIARSAIRVMSTKPDDDGSGTDAPPNIATAHQSMSVIDWVEIAPQSPTNDSSIIAGVNSRQSSRTTAESDSDYPSFGLSQSWDGSLRERDERKARELIIAFCVDALCELTFQNRDRLQIPWPALHSLLVRIIAPATFPSPVLERAVVALLRIGIRLLNRPELRDDVLRGLNLLVRLPTDTAEALSVPVVIGVHNMIEVHGAIIRSTSGWHAILSILENTAHYQPKAREIGLATLTGILRGQYSTEAISSESFAPLLDAILAYTSSSSVDISIRALDLLYLLAQRVPTFKDKIEIRKADFESSTMSAEMTEEIDVNSEENMWSEFWSPLFLGFAASIRDSRGKVRNHALGVVERVLALGGSAKFLSATEWSQTLTSVILPLMTQLFITHGFLSATIEAERAAQRKLLAEKSAAASVRRSRPRSFAVSAEHDEQMLKSVVAACNRTRMRAIFLTSKSFLQHHSVIASGLTDPAFTELWMAILEVFRVAYNSSATPEKEISVIKSEIRTPEQDEVLEHIPETVKNVLLVMCGCGLLSKSHEVRWNATFTMVRDFIPDIDEIISAATQGPLTTNIKQSNSSHENGTRDSAPPKQNDQLDMNAELEGSGNIALTSQEPVAST
ncbi:Sec7 [Gracilaria domingensis]|nr:Sec7 [Gracilaria domingensis]